MRRIATPALRAVPASLVLSAIERAAPGLARLGLRAHGRTLPRYLRTFPDTLAPFFGTVMGREAERARLIEARLVFLLTRAFLHQFLGTRSTAEASRQLGPFELRGASHLDAALAQKRGVILASAHFGLPPVIRLLIEGRGLPVVGVGGVNNARVDVVMGADVWTGARGLTRMREALAAGRVCIILVDVRRGRHTELPFLNGRMPVTVGAFRVAQMTQSPLLPAFAVLTGGTPRFRVEIGPPLPIPDRLSTTPFTEAATLFVRPFEELGRSYPGQLFGYQPVFASSPSVP
jgi:lauroyl/myristoyl acyltransferase